MSGLQTPETLVAEFVDEPQASQGTLVRRAPRAAVKPVSQSRISMDLEAWLEVDHTVHELYSYCEIALNQRDQARENLKALERSKLKSDVRNEKLAAHLKEWKGYAQKLERLLNEARMEALAQKHETDRARFVAQEALELGVFDGKRRKRLSAYMEGQ